MKVSNKEWIVIVLITMLYFGWFGTVVGLSMAHVAVYLIALAAYCYSDTTRRNFIAFCPFIVYLAGYDSLKAFPNFEYNDISIRELYNLEKSWFGVFFQDKLLTLNEYFEYHQSVVYDLVSGICYLTWVPVPVLFAIFLYQKQEYKVFTNFIFLFVLTNYLGFVGYYLYPAAPPWYVDMYGFDFFPDTLGEASRLGNFDRLIGIPIFEGIYSQNANVFAAVPSIHAANPFTCFIASLQMKNNRLKIGFLLLTLGMWFGAVYGNHHYLIDVLAGAFVVLLAAVLIYGLFRKSGVNQYLMAFENRISKTV